MLHITIPEQEWFNEDTNMFKTVPERHFVMEHSLLSISEWEYKYKRPFLNEKNVMSPEELLDYICMMCIPMVIDKTQIYGLTKQNLEDIRSYMENKPTATTYNKQSGPPSREIITSELIYCWMIQEQIPFEAQTWNIHRLLTLINVVAIKNQPPKKMSQADTMKRHASLNQARRAQHAKPHLPHK